MQDGPESNLKRVKSYFRANPGALFIVAFQVLLVSAAIFLVSGKSPTANDVAVYAFYALVIGVAIQVVVTVREERKGTRTNNSSQPPSS